MSSPDRGVLSGRVAVVTGGGRGIGRSLALALASHGASVVVSSRTRSDLDAVVLQMHESGSDALAVVAEATDPGSSRQPVTSALDHFGRVDILVNNVGGRPPDGTADGDPYACSDELFRDILTLNLLSMWWTTTAALVPMRSQSHGRIINIGSGNSTRAGGSVPYTAAKHGVVGLTKSLASAVASDGITVNCLCPGWTETAHNDWTTVGQRMGGLSAAEARIRAESENAQHRILRPDELGPVAVLLASDDGGAVTGQVVHADGGWKL